MTPAAQCDEGIKIGPSHRFFFAAGGAPSAIVVTLTSGFILLFYSNALGAPSAQVGAALALALLFDAIWDPFVGYISDNTKTRLGRRHPFLYAAIIPVTLLGWAVWNPPSSLTSTGLILYLLATIIPLRLTLALFDVPSTALTAELTNDYDERTKLSTYRTCASWLFITVFSALLYGYWLRSTPEYPDGLLNPAGYGEMGSAAATAVCVTMLACAVGLHRLIPQLPKPPNEVGLSFSDLFSSVFGTFREPILVPLLIASATISTGFSIYAALFPYQYAYFWQLNSLELSLTALPWGVGLVAAIIMAPKLVRIGEKRKLAGLAIFGLTLSISIPVLTGKLGLMPADGQSRLLVLSFFLFFDMLTYLVVTSSISSMLADAVEHRELQRGRREEGTIFAAQTLVLKLSSALGVLIAGILLQLIGFNAHGSNFAPHVIDRLGTIWIVGNAGFYLLSVLSLRFYRHTRQQHEANVERLRLSLSEATEVQL